MLAFHKFLEPTVHATRKLDSDTHDGHTGTNESHALRLYCNFKGNFQSSRSDMRIELLEQSWEKFIMLEVCKVGLEKLCNVCKYCTQNHTSIL